MVTHKYFIIVGVYTAVFVLQWGVLKPKFAVPTVWVQFACVHVCVYIYIHILFLHNIGQTLEPGFHQWM